MPMAKDCVVCVIGAHKTGTSSLTEVLEAAVGEPWSPHAMHARVFDAAGGIAWAKATGVRIVRDSPFNHGDAFKALDAAFPDAKFILTVRPPESWYASVCNWRKNPLVRKAGVYEALYAWSKTPKDDVIRMYEARNAAIRRYFAGRPGKLLELNLWKSAATAPLAEFLGCAPGSFPPSFPRANVNVKRRCRRQAHGPARRRPQHQRPSRPAPPSGRRRRRANTARATPRPA